MAFNTRISNQAARVGLDAILALLNVGGACTVEIRSGTQPASVDDVATGTVLATFTGDADAFADAIDSGGSATATANAFADVVAVATGTASWFRAYGGDTAPQIDGEIGLTGSDMTINKTDIVSGDDVSMTSWTAVHPE